MRKEYVTKTRSLILEYIMGQKSKQFSAADIFEFLQEKHAQINITTIYRNLDKLSEEGLLMRYKSADDKSCMYQYTGEAEKCQNHLHLKCQNCGKIIHLECEFMNEISSHLLKHHGFTVDCKGSMILGVCEQCREELENK